MIPNFIAMSFNEAISVSGLPFVVFPQRALHQFTKDGIDLTNDKMVFSANLCSLFIDLPTHSWFIRKLKCSGEISKKNAFQRNQIHVVYVGYKVNNWQSDLQMEKHKGIIDWGIERNVWFLISWIFGVLSHTNYSRVAFSMSVRDISANVVSNIALILCISFSRESNFELRSNQKRFASFWTGCEKKRVERLIVKFP